MRTWEQGDLGEASALEWLVARGAAVFTPFGHAPDFDLVAEMDDELHRVQVKTCRRLTPRGHYSVQLSTRGGNQSWSGTSKLFEQSRCDYLFVLVADGRRWFIPSAVIPGRSSITLGGPLYAEYEVEPGRPFGGIRQLEAAS